jgi:ribonuclease HI
MELSVYTDGGCWGNPGPGGWAFVLATGNDTASVIIERSGAEANTTNNRMELCAVIEALQEIDARAMRVEGINIFTDSQYVQKGMSEWISKWKKNGWRSSAKEPVKNSDLWLRLDALAGAYSIRWHWVRGHAGNLLNERCDTLTQQAIGELEGVVSRAPLINTQIVSWPLPGRR